MEKKRFLAKHAIFSYGPFKNNRIVDPHEAFAKKAWPAEFDELDPANDGPEVALIRFFERFPNGAGLIRYKSVGTPLGLWKTISGFAWVSL